MSYPAAVIYSPGQIEATTTFETVHGSKAFLEQMGRGSFVDVSNRIAPGHKHVAYLMAHSTEGLTISRICEHKRIPFTPGQVAECFAAFMQADQAHHGSQILAVARRDEQRLMEAMEKIELQAVKHAELVRNMMGALLAGEETVEEAVQ